MQLEAGSSIWSTLTGSRTAARRARLRDWPSLPVLPCGFCVGAAVGVVVVGVAVDTCGSHVLFGDV